MSKLTKTNFTVFQNKESGNIIKAWINDVPLEQQAKQQLINVAALPFIHKHVAVMPDCHWGMGATVGSVIPTLRAIIPAAVGVDLGCGMMAVKTSLTANDLPDNLKAMRSAIERAVPHGRSDNGGRNDRGSWGNVPRGVAAEWQHIEDAYKLIHEKHPKIAGRKGKGKTAEQLGTLGSGNHFIEVCLDQNNDVWIMLHSGSRGVGNRIGSYFIQLAKKDMEKWFINWLPDKDLSYFPEGTDNFADYTFAVKWAQDFARINREIMMENVIAAILQSDVPGFSTDGQVVNCHHNYVSLENHFGENVWVTRKGAVSAKQGEWGIIPGSMGAKSFIVVGKGNRDSFHSCSHGAGRVMSRTEAKKRFTVDQHKKATEGVECRKDAGVIDETPKAYKDIEKVMKAQRDLVDIRFTLKQVLCVKG
jgi:tRNA-splicing ligase RtcB (3'-phosphate/5'-hydroxy nucleic acid ligase)